MSSEELFNKWNELKKQNGPCPSCGLHTVQNELLETGKTWTFCTNCDFPSELRTARESRIIGLWKQMRTPSQEKPHEH
jgi:hypothetical protein